MRFSIHWSWLAAFSCVLCMGVEVWCDCTNEGLNIQGGDYKLTKEMKRSSVLIYQCPEDYYPYPVWTRYCQADSTWMPRPKRYQNQRCKIIECPDPHVLMYGTAYPSQMRYYVNNETTYECYSGHTLRGSSKRVCLPNGKWSGSTPICSYDTGENCPDPGIPAGASRIGIRFGIDDTVKYSCTNNLILVGSDERVCLEDGHWSGNEPSCYYKHTFDTPIEVSQEFGRAIRDSLTTLDNSLEGKSIRIRKHGTLNIYIAIDISESIEVQLVQEAKAAVSALITKIAPFSETPNYEIVFFSAEILEVVSILDFYNNNIKLFEMKKKLNDFELKGGDSTGTNLNAVFATFLEKMGVIKERVGVEAFKEHHHAIIVFTDGAYNMGGSPLPTVKKIKQMVYMNHTTDDSSIPNPRDDYLDIYIFGIGNDILDHDLQKLTAGTDGKHFFIMPEFKRLNETFDDIINEDDVKGQCGFYKDYDTGGKYGMRKMYPWMASIQLQFQGIKKACFGSLVSPRFVLTAAHCLPFGVESDDITVEIDDGQGRVKDIETFMRHPDYNINAKTGEGVEEFYDYDVALIQLKEDVAISSSVRPICIPCTRETSHALKLVGDITCKQHEQLLLKTHLERLSFLTKIGNKVAEKVVHAKLGTNRVECISHALGAPGITTTDATIPVTNNFLCTGGLVPFRDHISCKGDSGGAVFKNHEYRVVQMAVVSWGTHDLCKTSNWVSSDETSRDFHINLFKVIPFLESFLGNNRGQEYQTLTFLKP